MQFIRILCLLFQNVLETLQSKEPELTYIEDKAQQIGIEGSSADVTALQDQVKVIKDKMDKLKTDADKHSQYFGSLIAERNAFNTELAKTNDWLRQKEGLIRPHDQLAIDEDNIDTELSKLNDLTEDIYSTIGPMEEGLEEQKRRYEDNDEGIPLEIQDQIDTFEQLKDRIKVNIKVFIFKPVMHFKVPMKIYMYKLTYR